MLMLAEGARARRRAAHRFGLQSVFIKAHGGIEHPRVVRGINFERRVVRGDDGQRAAAQKMVSNGHGQRCALFRIGG